MKNMIVLGSILAIKFLFSDPIPIQFSISERKMVQEIPKKEKDFAFIIPGQLNTYIYDDESEYYSDYQNSYFAVTCKKAGWDCLRHYEILANGCIPYFIDLEECPENTMVLFPKKLILEAMNLEGVSYLNIDHQKFNKKRYFEILNELMDYTRKNLTTKKIAQYILNSINYNKEGKILFLPGQTGADYLMCCTLIGLKELLGERIVDYPKLDFMYDSFPCDLIRRAFTYTRLIEDIDIDRTNIEERIKKHEFDLIIYGSIHRGEPFKDLVKRYYRTNEIVYMCGEDEHFCQKRHLNQFFLREYPDPGMHFRFKQKIQQKKKI